MLKWIVDTTNRARSLAFRTRTLIGFSVSLPEVKIVRGVGWRAQERLVRNTGFKWVSARWEWIVDITSKTCAIA
jgi:hypothetical protein